MLKKIIFLSFPIRRTKVTSFYCTVIIIRIVHSFHHLKIMSRKIKNTKVIFYFHLVIRIFRTIHSFYGESDCCKGNEIVGNQWNSVLTPVFQNVRNWNHSFIFRKDHELVLVCFRIMASFYFVEPRVGKSMSFIALFTLGGRRF